MLRQKYNVLGRCAMLAILLFVLTATTAPIRATTEECILPKSGPWPPCATAGDTPPTVSSDCIIPDHGPWPPCATSSNPPSQGNPPSQNGDGECVIPPSGPWPPCAKSGNPPSQGNPPPQNGGGECVIPPSGPWPPCAKGGGGVPDPSLTPVPPEPDAPEEERVPDWVIATLDHTNDDQLAVGDYVRFLGDLKSPSAPVRLQWHISSASKVTFSYVPANYGSGGFYMEGSSSGETLVSHNPVQGGTDAVYMISTDTGIFTAITLALPCEYQWNPIFTANPNHTTMCPIYDSHTRAFHQNFEGGIIIWLQSDSDDAPHTLFVTDWSGAFHHEVIDTYIKGIDPIKDVTITPPGGMYQPEYGVGKVWRDNPDIREKLGWATDWGQFYSAHEQGLANDRYRGLDYISLYGNGFIARHYPQPWVVQP